MTEPTSTQFYSLGTAIQSTDAFVTYFSTVNPSPTQYHFPIGKRWVNTTTANEFILANLVSSNGTITANWLNLTTGS